MDRDERLPTLDPFVFPQETRGRFRMFIAAAILFAWSLGGWVIAVPGPHAFDWRLSPERDREWSEIMDRLMGAGLDSGALLREAMQQVWKPPDGADGPARLQEHLQQISALIVSQMTRILVSLVFVTGVLVLAWVAYRRHAVGARRHYRTQPLASSAVQREVVALAKLAGIEAPVEVAVKPGFLDGVAFGTAGREVLVLGGEPSWLARAWNDVLRAVALHEMAHIVNGDIRTREVSRYLWWCLGGLMALLLVLITAASLVTGELRYPLIQPPDLTRHLALWSQPPVWTLLLKVGVVTGVVWWMWSGLIRVREFYADARVAQWGFRQPLLDRLRLQETTRSGWQILRRHPTQAERRKVLEAPQELFRATPELAALTGLLFALLVAQLGRLLSDAYLLAFAPLSMLALISIPLLVAVVVGVLFALSSTVVHSVVSALGVQVQRESLAEIAHGRSGCGYSRLGKTALFFVLGLEFGLSIAPFGPFRAFQSPSWTSGWICIFAFLVWLWLVFVKAGVRQILSTVAGHRVNLWRRALMLASSFMLTLLMVPAMAFRFAIEAARQEAWLEASGFFSVSSIQFFMTAFVWVGAQLLLYAALIYGAMFASLVLIAELRSWWRRPTCPHCDARVPFAAIGEVCHACCRPLASWAYAEASR